MKKIILVFTVLAFACLSSECLAQKVKSHIVDGVTYAVIDNIALPIGAIKSKSDLIDEKDNDDQMKDHIETDLINKKVSPRFAVSKKHVNKAGGAIDGAVTMTWEEAKTACAAYMEGTTNDWRLPTQLESMLIYQMKTELKVITDFVDFNTGDYWTSTKKSVPQILYYWRIKFANGTLFYVIGTGRLNVRCIRDL